MFCATASTVSLLFSQLDVPPPPPAAEEKLIAPHSTVDVNAVVPFK